MIPDITEFGLAVAAHLTTDAGKAAARSAFAFLKTARPDLDARAAAAQAAGNISEIESVFSEGIGVIVAAASSGQISIDQATLSAIRGIKFDHQHGTVKIGNTTVNAAVLVTGGGAGATGQTHIGGNTELKSQGTAIKIGEGAAIVMTGGARIIQN